jgi:hypothetical protein
MTSNNLEDVLRENLDLRRQLMGEVAKAEEPVTLAQRIRIGREEDQPLVFALLLVVIAVALYYFFKGGRRANTRGPHG